MCIRDRAYTGVLATAGDQAAPTVEKPEYPLTPSPVADAKTLEDKEEKLPATGEHGSEAALFLASVSIALSAVSYTHLKQRCCQASWFGRLRKNGCGSWGRNY